MQQCWPQVRNILSAKRLLGHAEGTDGAPTHSSAPGLSGSTRKGRGAVNGHTYPHCAPMEEPAVLWGPHLSRPPIRAGHPENRQAMTNGWHSTSSFFVRPIRNCGEIVSRPPQRHPEILCTCHYEPQTGTETHPVPHRMQQTKQY